jgi:hypothetical protein
VTTGSMSGTLLTELPKKVFCSFSRFIFIKHWNVMACFSMLSGWMVVLSSRCIYRVSLSICCPVAWKTSDKRQTYNQTEVLINK